MMTLTKARIQTARVETYVSQFTYKSQTSFVVNLDMREELIQILFMMAVPDVRNPKDAIGVYRQHVLEPEDVERMDEGTLLDYLAFLLRAIVLDAESHEVDEWLKCAGNHVKEPRHA